MSDENDASGFDYKEEVGFGEVQTSTFPKYQGHAKVTDRVAVLSHKLLRSFSYYVDEANIRFRVDKNPPAWLVKKLGQPEQKFALVFFKYATDEEGELLVTDRLKGKICIWVFSETKFDQVKSRFQKYPLMNGKDEQRDLLISCSDTQYQKLDFDVTDGAHWRTKPEWVKALEEKLPDALRRADWFLGARKSDEEVKQALGMVTGGGPAGASDDDVDLGDVVDD